MNYTGIKSTACGLDAVGIVNTAFEYWNLTPEELIEESLVRGEGELADNGALCVNTGEFTGRSPKDKFMVMDDITRDTIWWEGSFNTPFEPGAFDALHKRMASYLQGCEVYVRDVYAGADPNYRVKVRVITETPWHNLFAYNMFIEPTAEERASFVPDWTVINAPDYHATAAEDGTRQHNFSILNFTKKIALVGGSAYTGEIKKGIFTVMNFELPFKGVLPMHCSANVGRENKDTAIFFGLSGTGKTTLSADPLRDLIGDDEHGWTPDGVFNFEGGCYAKTINLSAEGEPEIWGAIKHGALVENTTFLPGTRTIDFADGSITENTRVSYPLSFIPGALEPSVGGVPKNIFFLTCDAFGVLPPISRLNPGQAMYQFISGYTAKVAGTEVGVTEPTMTFSTCFGAPFLPLHPAKYAEMLGDKIRQYGTNVWLINTGWTGGAYGTGSRMKLRYTRAMITAALNGELDNANYDTDPVFGFEFPIEVANVPSEVLNPRNTWADKDAFDAKRTFLAHSFNEKFKQFESLASEEIRAAAPKA